MTSLHEFLSDIRFALRRTRRRPVLAIATILTLSLGIGTAVTFLGAADAILLRPLPLEEPDRVVTLWRTRELTPDDRSGLAPGTIVDLVESTRSLQSLAGAQPFSHRIERDGDRLSIGSWLVTSGFFDVMRIRPLHGRLLDSADFVAGNERTVVVSARFWRTHLGGDPAALDKLERLNGTAFRIVGILPDDFPYEEGRDLYVPARIAGSFRENRTDDYWSTYGRLADGISIEGAQRELSTLAARSDSLAVGSEGPRRLVILPITDSMLGEIRAGIGLLAIGAVLLLAMAAANASGLLVADTMSRARELAVRASVGAGRERIRRQLLTESLVPVALATLLGAALGAAGLQRFKVWAPPSLPRLAELEVDPRLGLVALGVGMLVAVIVGIAPSRLASAADLHSTLKGAADAETVRGRRFRAALVGTQVALAVLLLSSGGLLVRSWMVLTAVDQGYDPTGVVAIEQHVWGTHGPPDARVALGQQLPARLRELPGVEAAAIASALPLAPAVGDESSIITPPDGATPIPMHAMAITPGYFDALRIGRVAGRDLGVEDGPTGEPVVIINERAAARLFPQGDALGRMIGVNVSGIAEGPRRIIGIVRDVRYGSLEQEAPASIYVPHTQAPTGSIYIVTRHRGDAATGLGVVQRAVREALPGNAVNEVVILEQVHRTASVARRFSMLLLGAFAVVALLLTAIGLSGLLTQLVRLRERELGVRLALGAWPAQLRALLMREGLRLVGVGFAIGLAAFLVASGALGAMLYGVPARDPLTVGLVALVVLAVGVLASWGPATLATRVDPLRALRAD